MIFRRIREAQERKKTARALYEQAARQALEPVFYRDWGVPDTLDGRFEMICLHMFLLMDRIKVQGQGAKLGQKLFDAMFKIMEPTLREIGIGDLSVPRHMKRMMTAFNGRIRTYDAAVTGQEDLKNALRRNVYGTIENPSASGINALADYVTGMREVLSYQDVVAGNVSFGAAEKERRHG